MQKFWFGKDMMLLALTLKVADSVCIQTAVLIYSICMYPRWI